MKIFLPAVFIIAALFPAVSAAGEVSGPLKIDPYLFGTASIKEKTIDFKLMEIIDKSSLGEYLEDPEQNESSSAALYNLKKASIEIPGPENYYLNNLILQKSNQEMLDYLTPEDYYILDMPQRDNSPLSRYSVGLNTLAQVDSDIVTRASNAVLDYVFGALTRNILSVNVVPSDKNEGVSVEVKPIKNLIFKFSRVEEIRKESQIFELQILPTKNTNLTFKTTTDNGTSAITGVEFQMTF